ncbi:hypothetical protein C8Q79DRAFT_1005629 [Trametes meyenii]|nr:hypothetical protein C8Q79DRAFT_1005629 [Trametes meyenii]
MAFAQFYYDPALEFERMLEDDGSSGPGTNAQAGSIAPAPGIPSVAGPFPPAAADAQVPAAAAALAKDCGAGAITRAASIAAGETHPSQGSRWFGEGLLKRRASTGSVHAGSHPGVPK